MTPLNKYYLAEAYDEQQFNAGIVRKDNEKILSAAGFNELKFKQSREGSVAVKINRIISAIQIGFSVEKNSLVILHFPLQATVYAFLLRLLQYQGIKTAALIIDIDGIRDKDEALLKKEISQLQKFTYLVAHNESMKRKLLEYIPSACIFTIDIFDYPGNVNKAERSLTNSICFAGSAAKAGFTYKLNQLPALHFNLYGQYDDTLLNQPNITNKGLVSPQFLPELLEGSFGLVWDGNAIEKCDDYLRFNNPHKLSLYLAAGLPVIVWKKSAVADYVIKNEIGLTVNSLEEIVFQLKNISADAYKKMQLNAIKIGTEISTGKALQKVIATILAAEI